MKLLILRTQEKNFIAACEQQASVAAADQGFDITGGCDFVKVWGANTFLKVLSDKV